MNAAIMTNEAKVDETAVDEIAVHEPGPHHNEHDRHALAAYHS